MPTMPISLTRSLAIALITLALSPWANADDHDKSCYAPQLLGFIDGLNNPTYMTIRDNLAYIIEDNTSFVIIDIADPEFMTLLSRTQIIIKQANAITLNGDVAYLKHDDGFSVYNIADPTDPWFVRPYDVYIDNNSPLVTNADYMYLGNGNIFNIARPMAPVLESTNDNWNTDPIGIVIDRYAYTLDDAVYDVTDPSIPIFVQSGYSDQYDHIKFYDPFILKIEIDASFWIHEPYINSDESTQSQQRNAGQFILKDAALRKSILYAAQENFAIYDVSATLGNWLPLATYADAPGFNAPTQVEIINDDFVLITDASGNLAAYRFNTNPVGSHAIQGESEEVKITENLALVATTGPSSTAGVFTIFDIADPTRPVRKSSLYLRNPQALDISGTTAYVAAKSGGLAIVDFSDPEYPKLINTYITNTDPKQFQSTRDIQIVGDLAYALDYNTGLHILNIADPENPQVISITDLPEGANEITVHDNLAVISHGPNDIEIYDISDLASPTLLSTIPPHPDPVVGVQKTTVHNNLLYTAEYFNGYRVFDITNPSKPIELARIHTDVEGFVDVSHEVVIRGNTLYLANGSAGLYIFDNTDPTNPILMNRIPGSIPQGGYRVASYRNIALRDDLAYLASFNAGLRIVDINGCTPPCTPDFNNDGSLNFLDISAFITAFESRDPASDINADGRWNFFDISAFLTLFAQGCP